MQASFGTADEGLYIHTFTAFCDTLLLDINDKAGEAPALFTKNDNDDNIDQRQKRIAEPFMFLHLIFMHAESWGLHTFFFLSSFFWMVLE